VLFYAKTTIRRNRASASQFLYAERRLTMSDYEINVVAVAVGRAAGKVSERELLAVHSTRV